LSWVLGSGVVRSCGSQVNIFFPRIVVELLLDRFIFFSSRNQYLKVCFTILNHVMADLPVMKLRRSFPINKYRLRTAFFHSVIGTVTYRTETIQYRPSAVIPMAAQIPAAFVTTVFNQRKKN